jgi:hypothetical protein
LVWNVASWADSYTLQVSTSPDFSTTLINVSGIKTASYLLTGLEHGTTYYWRVNASNSYGTSGWSSVCDFTTLPEIPDIPILELPYDESINQDIALQLSWYPSERAESYTLQVSTSPDFTNLVYDQSGITTTNFPVSNLNFETTYYWRVSASNITGTSDWSEVWSFTTYPLELHLINLVIIDGQNNPNFMIGGIQYCPENNLTVFTKWGKKVFAKSGYNNELDFSNYPAGTYYYVLNVTMRAGQKQYKSFVDVVKQ